MEPGALDLDRFERLLEQGRQSDKLAEWWPVPEVLAALAEATAAEPFELAVELGGVLDEIARWLNPLVLRVLRCG